jgi:GMP synthase (glutamine-hydrolysing)
MPTDIHEKRILILDFGSQYSQLIARRVRETGVYCEIHPYHISEEFIRNFNPAGVILSGGPESVRANHTPRAPSVVFAINCPVLGICYGMQTMASQLGGVVSDNAHSEFGHAELFITQQNNLFQENKTLDVWMSHGDQVVTLPPDFETIAHTNNTPIAVMANRQKNFYGIQFHPEVTHTPKGKMILEQFVHRICHCKAAWTMENIIEESIEKIRQKTGTDKVILGLSGGVDSLVAAVLLQKAIGENLTCIYVDHGLQREQDERLLHIQTQRLGLNVIRINASERFLTALKNIIDPEAKRKIIGKLFIDVFTEEAQKIPDVKWLAQGTIYSDVIESSPIGAQSHTIKSHHNVGGLPERLSLSLLEPLRELFKDEVRELGLALGLPYEEVYRHPFPGPGLAVRIMGEITPEALQILRKADTIFMQELFQQNLYHQLAQAFCVYLPVNSVGVVGDARQYAPVIALRAVESIDFMTAKAAALPHDFLQSVARRIVNEVKNISRVVYDITSKPPATIEWE